MKAKWVCLFSFLLCPQVLLCKSKVPPALYQTGEVEVNLSRLASLTFLAKVSHQLAGSCVSAWEYKISSPLNSLLPEGEPKSCLTLFYSRVGTEV